MNTYLLTFTLSLSFLFFPQTSSVGSNAMWSTNAVDRSHDRQFRMTLRTDGRLVQVDINDVEGWSTENLGDPAYLELQNNGNVAIFGITGSVIWSRF